jgi:hypothetical protein
MKKILKKTYSARVLLLALVILIQSFIFNVGFGTIQVNATGITDKRYWNYKNIGDTNEYSTADILSNSVIVDGSGTGQFNTKDSFTYAYIPVHGDCTIRAEIINESCSDTSAKAGLMIRESLNDDSRNAFLALNLSNELIYQDRTITGGETTTCAAIESGITVPVYLKLTRTGNNIEAFKSNDGTNWSPIGNTQTINMDSKVYLGFASTSSNPNNLCTARFENIDVQYTDITAPSAPANLRVVDFDDSTCHLAWDEASDDSGVALYEVYKDNNLVGRTHNCSFAYSAYPGGSNTFNVVAVDAAGNKSAANSQTSIVTQNAMVSSADITNVRLNSKGLERLNARRQQQNLPLVQADTVQVGEEILTDSTLNNVTVEGVSVDLNTIYSLSLPKSVDNSTLPCFPNIGYQIYGDCTLWSSTYYTMTHMVGLSKIIAGGTWDAKNDTSKVFSPKFTYSIGSSPLQGMYGTLMEAGSATLADVPYADDGVQGKKVCTDLNAWENAINYRMDTYGTISTNQANLDRIKQFLNNGYIFSFGTDIGNFLPYGTPVIDNPDSSVNDAYMVGKKVYNMVDANGVNSVGHQMTLVGYDDDIWWGDVNGDGIPQQDEKGVFKIANSWGANNGYDGYWYITYDSIYPTSNFSQFNNSTRLPITNELNWITPKRNYQPQLIAEFTVSHAKADQLKIAVGYSDINKTLPEAYLFSNSLNFLPEKAPFDYNSQGVAVDGNFAVDLTDFITKFNLSMSSKYRWYLMVGDSSSDGSPVTLKSFRLHNKTSDRYATYSSSKLPIQNDGGDSFAYIDYSWLPVGDLDGDGMVTELDFTLMTSYLQGKISDFPVADDMWAGDVNGDGLINALDNAQIKRFLLGYITLFPKEQYQ